MTETGGVRGALAAIGGFTACVGFYAILRLVQRVLFQEPDPALIIWSEHAGYFWRVWTAAYLAGMLAFVTYLAAGRDPERTARVLATSTVVVTLLAAAQGLLVP